jgi:hypothetical protein
LKIVGGSKSVRGRKKRRNAMNHAPRNPVTATHTRRRRRSLTWLGSGPTVANPAEAAAFDVPTAGVPTYLVGSPPPAADVFGASGFGLPASVSGPAIRYLLDQVLTKLRMRRGQAFIPAVEAHHRRSRHKNEIRKVRRKKFSPRRGHATILWEGSGESREQAHPQRASGARRIGEV